MKIYHVETQENYDALMIEFEDKGYTWNSDAKPRNYNGFKSYGKDTYIYDEYGVISLSSGEYFKKYHSDETLVEYKAKGENMLNTECKQCHKKWHHTNAKYCSMCGKKLLSEPDFKSGDIVASQVFSDGSFSLVRLNKDLTNRLTPVNGFWYTKRDCDIVEASFGVFKEDTRKATPEEIAEYESALTFHKHGRKPFEVKDGDLLENVFGKYIAHKSLFVKENFTVEGHTFLKTAEEIDEWLGVSDE